MFPGIANAICKVLSEFVTVINRDKEERLIGRLAVSGSYVFLNKPDVLTELIDSVVQVMTKDCIDILIAAKGPSVHSIGLALNFCEEFFTGRFRLRVAKSIEGEEVVEFGLTVSVFSR